MQSLLKLEKTVWLKQWIPATCTKEFAIRCGPRNTAGINAQEWVLAFDTVALAVRVGPKLMTRRLDMLCVIMCTRVWHVGEWKALSHGT